MLSINMNECISVSDLDFIIKKIAACGSYYKKNRCLRQLMKEGCVVLEHWIEDAFSMGLADLSLKSTTFLYFRNW